MMIVMGGLPGNNTGEEYGESTLRLINIILVISGTQAIPKHSILFCQPPTLLLPFLKLITKPSKTMLSFFSCWESYFEGWKIRYEWLKKTQFRRR
jgi:hypothetical protein